MWRILLAIGDGITDNILKNPGRLTEAEFEIMKDHARIGGEMLAGSDIPMFNTAAIIASCHHEKWDGTGYPNGLKAEEIPEAPELLPLLMYTMLWFTKEFTKMHFQKLKP